MRRCKMSSLPLTIYVTERMMKDIEFIAKQRDLPTHRVAANLLYRPVEEQMKKYDKLK
jgi:hypothetical protein